DKVQGTCPRMYSHLLLPHSRALIRLLRDAWREYQRDYAKYFALAMVYYALAALVPLLLLVLATLGLLLRVSPVVAETEPRWLQAGQAGLGPDRAGTLDKLLTRLQDGSLVALGVSVLALLFTGLTLFLHLRLSFRALWKHEPPLASRSVRGAVRETLREK